MFDFYKTCSYIILFVSVIPVIGPGSNRLVLRLYHRALLPCAGYGLPTPTVQWFKDGKPLSYLDKRYQFISQGSLDIHPVLEKDAGNYTCIVSNSEGNRTREISLKLYPRKSKVEWSNRVLPHNQDSLTYCNLTFIHLMLYVLLCLCFSCPNHLTTKLLKKEP